MATICVAGGWHQASVIGACFAELGHEVRGVVADAATLARLSSARAPVHEPGLDVLLARHIASGRLRYTMDYASALEDAAFAYIALDTPVGEDDSPELDPVFAAASAIARGLTGEIVLCVSAQVPAGTCDELGGVVADESRGVRCTVAYVPEFLRLGTAIETFFEADRFVIGCDDAEVAERIAALYSPLGRPIVRMSVRSAEMAKHACNAFLACSISFINEIANLCEATRADVADVVRAMRFDRRIGPQAFLTPGLGFAGGTLGRDVRALQRLSAASGGATPLLDAVISVNASRAGLVAGRLRGIYGAVEGLRVGVLGLTYKPGTSTLRRSVALEVITDLVAGGADVRACDPLADFSEATDLPDFALCADPLAVADGADALVLLTGWDELRTLDLAEVARRMRRPVLLDTRDFFDAESAARAGLSWYGIGRE